MYGSAPSEPTARASSRQLLVLAVCAVGLVVAALAMPATAPSPGPLPLDFLNQDSDCTIALSETPVPGQSVTATIRYDGDPVRDSRVWFNDRAVGQTDEDGRVTGTVPYQKQLRIRVELPSGGRCRVGSSTGGEVSQPDSLGPSQAGLGPVAGRMAQAQQAANGSSEYPVSGRIDIAVDRQPYPGEATTIRATIVGNPVADATVSVDGQQVGRTDADGVATIRAPERGDGTLRVAVERGEFRSVRRVTVLRLDVAVRSTSFPAVPGQQATVAATLGDRPARNATVTMGGTSLGRTDASGTVDARLPADPTARVSVATADQTDSYPVALVYLPTVLFALLSVVVSVGIPIAGYAAGGRRGFVGGVLAVGVVYALTAGYLVGGGTGLLAALALVVLAVAVVSFHRSDHDTGSAARSLQRAIGRFGDRLFSDTLWLTGRIESLLDGIGRRVDRFGERLSAASLADVPSWLAGPPARLRSRAGHLAPAAVRPFLGGRRR